MRDVTTVIVNVPGHLLHDLDHAGEPLRSRLGDLLGSHGDSDDEGGWTFSTSSKTLPLTERKLAEHIRSLVWDHIRDLAPDARIDVRISTAYSFSPHVSLLDELAHESLSEDEIPE